MPAPALEVKKLGDAGWSSPVARQAHNLKVAGSNPAPATKQKKPRFGGAFLLFAAIGLQVAFVARSATAQANRFNRPDKKPRRLDATPCPTSFNARTKTKGSL